MSQRPNYEIDKKTKLTLPMGLQVAILVCVFSSGVLVARINMKLGRVVTYDQMQEWGYRLQQANNPWRKDFRVPPFPRQNEPVGEKTRNVAENE